MSKIAGSSTMQWQGVMPAITTAFHADMTVDHEFVAKHAKWLVDNGSTGIVALGSLGEGRNPDERRESSGLINYRQGFGREGSCGCWHICAQHG